MALLYRSGVQYTIFYPPPQWSTDALSLHLQLQSQLADQMGIVPSSSSRGLHTAAASSSTSSAPPPGSSADDAAADGLVGRISSGEHATTWAALVDGLAVSRSGEFTCPVKSGAIFLGALPSRADALPGHQQQTLHLKGGPSGSFPVRAGSGSVQSQPERALVQDWRKWSLEDGSGSTGEGGSAEERGEVALAVVDSWTEGYMDVLDGVQEVAEVLDKVRSIDRSWIIPSLAKHWVETTSGSLLTLLYH